MLKKKFEREKIATYKVTAFIGPGGEHVSSFKACTVVMVSPVGWGGQGPSIPHSREMFKADTELGDTYTEVIQRFFHYKE